MYRNCLVLIAVLVTAFAPFQLMAAQAYNYEDGAGFVYEDFLKWYNENRGRGAAVRRR